MTTKPHSLRITGGAKVAALCAVAAASLLTACSVTLPKTGEESYEVTEKYEYSDGKPRTEHSVKGGELLLKSSGCGAGADKYGVKYIVEVRASASAHLTLGGGEITVRGLSGATYAKCDGGSVQVSESRAKSVTAIVDGGDASASFSAVPDQVRVSGGGDATVPPAPGRVRRGREHRRRGSQGLREDQPGFPARDQGPHRWRRRQRPVRRMTSP